MELARAKAHVYNHNTPGSLRFLNREAPSGWRLERPLVAPPPRTGISGSQWGPGRVLEGGQRWSIPAVCRASGLAVGGRGTRGGSTRGGTRGPIGPMEGRPGGQGGRGRAVIDDLVVRNRAGGRGPGGEVMQGWRSQWLQSRRLRGGAGAADGRRPWPISARLRAGGGSGIMVQRGSIFCE